MKKESILYTKPLKDQIYEYLRGEISKQRIQPGSVINMDATSRKLGISKTPLRDALIQLEMEGFVSIAPRKGIYVNQLIAEDIKNFYQVIGALEHAALNACRHKLKQNHINKMKRLMDEMNKALEADNFRIFYKKNLEFHNTYILKANNPHLIRVVDNLKKRLYEFPIQDHWVKEWELASMKEHEEIVRLLGMGEFSNAADYIRDVHWSYSVQESFIKKYYFPEPKTAPKEDQ